MTDTAPKRHSIPEHPIRNGLWRRLLLGRFEQIKVGRLKVYEGSDLILDTGQAPDGEAVPIYIRSYNAYRAMALGGALGASEAYMDGDWNCENLLDVLQLFLKNRDVMSAMDAGLVKFQAPLRRFQHWLNRDTLAQSKRNIAAHYDLGNTFFEQFLDQTMTYSSGYFVDPQQTMLEGSEQKLDLICRKMKLKPSDHILEIGTGWGGFALHAAKHFGCKVTTTTISQAQFEWATARVREANLEDRIELLQLDYRRLEGRFDKIVSIEMIEAVGLKFLPLFFETCAGLLRPGGSMLLQAITIAEQRFEAAKRSVDFIQRYIFPGGALASVNELVGQSASEQAG
ncbi:MAG: SAM-dependent methyltransferase, partial [Pseudomonadales bacterium]